MNFDWKKTIGAVAPMLGTALGGPFGALAGSVVATALGSENNEAALSAAIKGVTPEQLLVLKNAENEFQVHMAELGYQSVTDLERIAAGDRSNARSREIALKDWMPRVLGLVVVGGFFGVLALMIFKELPSSGRDSLLVLVGALGAEFSNIMRYYFGTSASSASKNAMLGNAIKGSPRE